LPTKRSGGRVPPVRRARPARNGWRYFEIDASHNPHITAPQALLDLLAKIASTAA
jgi:hypothetical protein